MSTPEAASQAKGNVQVEELFKKLQERLDHDAEFEEHYMKIAQKSANVADKIGDLHENPELSKVREVSALLRSIEATAVSLQVDYVRQRALTSKLHAVVVQADQSKFSAEERSIMAALEAKVREIDVQDEKLSSLNGQLTDLWRSLEAALTTLYAELREERQTAFQNRMEILGAIVALMVAVFTVVSTLKTLGVI